MPHIEMLLRISGIFRFERVNWFQARGTFETSSLAPHQVCFMKRSDAEFMQ